MNGLRLFSATVAALLAAPAVRAADVKVMNSGGFSAAYRTLAPAFEAAAGDRLQTVEGPSMGTTPQAIPLRLERGEPADVVIMARGPLDDLARKGKVVPGSQTDLARSRIAMVVRAGAPVPDIATVEGLKRALLKARSVAYSDSASGTYISQELYRRLGIEDRMTAKSRKIPGTPVGLTVARGEAEIGFQQLSELLPVAGVTIVGLIPQEVQRVTVFSAGLVVSAPEPAGGRRLIGYLASPAAYDAIRKSGLEPAAAP